MWREIVKPLFKGEIPTLKADKKVWSNSHERLGIKKATFEKNSKEKLIFIPSYLIGVFYAYKNTAAQ